MDKAKAKVGEFLHRSGHHDTTVHEHVQPAVTHETVKPHQHENTTTAIDREVHQDHHHTSIQPVHDRQVLPEQHHHRVGDVHSTEHHHGDHGDIRAKLQQEQAQFRDRKDIEETTASHQEHPVVTGEHRHHHVHEAIQPVVKRETIEPHVVHSVNRVHETHNAAPQVHSASTLPAMTIDEFKGQGGTLTGREERTDGFDGEPRHIGHALSGGHHAPNPDSAGRISGTDRTGTQRSRSRSSSRERRGLGNAGYAGEKPSLKDKLNPKVDADGDGKPGILS